MLLYKVDMSSSILSTAYPEIAAMVNSQWPFRRSLLERSPRHNRSPKPLGRHPCVVIFWQQSAVIYLKTFHSTFFYSPISKRSRSCKPEEIWEGSISPWYLNTVISCLHPSAQRDVSQQIFHMLSNLNETKHKYIINIYLCQEVSHNT